MKTIIAHGPNEYFAMRHAAVPMCGDNTKKGCDKTQRCHRRDLTYAGCKRWKTTIELAPMKKGKK